MPSPSRARIISSLLLSHSLDNQHGPRQHTIILKVITLALCDCGTYTHMKAVSVASGLVAAASRVTWHLTSLGSGAMTWHPALQGHVLRSKGKRSAFFWRTPELANCVNLQHFIMDMHPPYYCNTKQECFHKNTHKHMPFLILLPSATDTSY